MYQVLLVLLALLGLLAPLGLLELTALPAWVRLGLPALLAASVLLEPLGLAVHRVQPVLPDLPVLPGKTERASPLPTPTT